MSYQDNQKNISDPENQKPNTIDRMYNNSQSFLYRYRWWIVLILAILLGIYLFTRRQETVVESPNVLNTSNKAPTIPSAESTSTTKSTWYGMPGGAFNFASPAPPDLPTETRQLFRL